MPAPCSFQPVVSGPSVTCTATRPWQRIQSDRHRRAAQYDWRCHIPGPVAVPERRSTTLAATVTLLVASLLSGLALGDTLYFAAIPRIGVARALPISMGYPVLTALLAVAFLNESIGPVSAIAMALTLLGVYLVARPERGATEEYVRLGPRLLGGYRYGPDRRVRLVDLDGAAQPGT